MKSAGRLAVLATVALCAGAALAQSQQAIRDQLFRETDIAKREADALDGKLLAPVAYAAGLEHYVSATETLEKGRDLDAVRREATEAKAQFERAIETAKLAQVTFANVLEVRAAAMRAEAPRYVEKNWTRAEEALVAAAEQLEDGNLNKATAAMPDVERRYRETEARAMTAKARGE